MGLCPTSCVYLMLPKQLQRQASLMGRLKNYEREDPTYEYSRGSTDGRNSCICYELHMEVVEDKLKRQFKIASGISRLE